MLLVETRFLASKNGFEHLTGMEFFRRHLKNWQKTERATNVCREVEYLSNFTSWILEGKNTSLSIEERSKNKKPPAEAGGSFLRESITSAGRLVGRPVRAFGPAAGSAGRSDLDYSGS
jgi:hypothetical protein